MKKLNETKIVEAMRDAYIRRLHEVIGETDVKDKRDNIVISPGLKVRHKQSQYEYTVRSVKKDPATGDIKITLNNPELPRFTPQGGQKFVGEEAPMLTSAGGSERPSPTSSMIDAVLSADGDPATSEQNSEGTTFVVNREAFEKEYEVK